MHIDIQIALIGIGAAIIGGLIVIAGQYFQRFLTTQDRLADRRRVEKINIIKLAMSVDNWLEMDQQRVYQAGANKQPLTEIEYDHPLHSLVAAIISADVDLNIKAVEMRNCFKTYAQVTRIHLPAAKTSADVSTQIKLLANEANKLGKLLDEVIVFLADS